MEKTLGTTMQGIVFLMEALRGPHVRSPIRRPFGTSGSLREALGRSSKGLSMGPP